MSPELEELWHKMLAEDFESATLRGSHEAIHAHRRHTIASLCGIKPETRPAYLIRGRSWYRLRDNPMPTCCQCLAKMRDMLPKEKP